MTRTVVHAEVYPPLLADTVPMPESREPFAGTSTLASRRDHRHPRLSSSTVNQLAANGEVAVMFTRTFPARPAVTLTAMEEADNPPVLLKVKLWIRDGSAFTGCVVRGYRPRTLPNLGALNGLAAITGALSGFSVFGGSAAGVEFTCLAVQAS